MARAEPTARFRSPIGVVCRGDCARRRKFEGLRDKRLVVSSLTGNVLFTGQDARGTVEMYDMRASTKGMTSTAPLATFDGTFSFPAREGTAGQLRGTTGEWTADFGDSRVEGSSVSGNLVFTSERMLGSLRATDIKASSLKLPFAEMKSVSVAGHR
jgi:hypothetical protein